ncbi:hypothetical protein IC582_006332 [Cucumis melo]|uniref:Epidermal patterning factor-like protein n=1 Tax=Cucumis melo TaxID=3656 RepID=A0A1S3BBM2_CUCME|nr:EPIDERMAL PATTERNING FACTOR-like protein 2 [Cucumis melo]
MGSFQIWHRNRNKHVSILLLFLSVFILILVTSIEGRGIQAMEGERKSAETVAVATEEEEEKMGMMMRNQIGSRPPSCRRKCMECGGHCEAVQVPVALHDSNQNQKKGRRRRRSSRRYFSDHSKHDVALSSEDETSNYKPISWKCKCGNFIFNP